MYIYINQMDQQDAKRNSNYQCMSKIRSLKCKPLWVNLKVFVRLINTINVAGISVIVNFIARIMVPDRLLLFSGCFRKEF